MTVPQEVLESVEKLLEPGWQAELRQPHPGNHPSVYEIRLIRGSESVGFCFTTHDTNPASRVARDGVRSALRDYALEVA